MIAVALALGVTAVVPAAPASGQSMRLTKADARFYVKKTLRMHYGSAWRYGYAKQISCWERLSNRKARFNCVRWLIGDVGWDGRVVIKLDACPTAARWCWYHGYRLTYTDYYHDRSRIQRHRLGHAQRL